MAGLLDVRAYEEDGYEVVSHMAIGSYVRLSVCRGVGGDYLLVRYFWVHGNEWAGKRVAHCDDADGIFKVLEEEVKL